MSTPEGRSKGCAMILFEKWSQAEVAIEACHGKSFFGTNRALVVNLADPPRRGGGLPPIAPKTLFVGQVPKTIEDEEVRALFEPFGEINEFHISRKGSVSGCAFVKFSLWSEAENAMEALHGRHTLPGAKNPLVVKFADAKDKEPITTATTTAAGTVITTHSNDSAALLAPLGLKYPHPSQLLEQDWQTGTKLAFQSSMSGSSFPFNDVSASWQQSPAPIAAAAAAASAIHPYQSLSRSLGFNGVNVNSPSGPPPGAYGMNGSPQYFSTFGNGSRAPPLPPPYSVSSAYATMLVGGGGGNPPPLLGNQMGGGIMTPTNTNGSGGGTANAMMNVNLASQTNKSVIQQQQQSVMLQHGLTGAAGKLGSGITDPIANEWKLFVGQVPFECSEQDLWPIFSEVGEILELVILRSEGRSKGCAFVTYADKETAELATTRLNGQVTVPSDRRGKRLVVRFADKKKSEINWSNFTEDVKTE
eukprot:g6369.t1